jgi:hypothetical protein
VRDRKFKREIKMIEENELRDVGREDLEGYML